MRSRIIRPLAVLALCAIALAQQDAREPTAPGSDAERAAAADEPRVTIRFKGRLPGSIDPKLAGTFRVEFCIYPSPQGGASTWREARDVVAADGDIDVELGAVAPIPLAIHNATFKWLGASVGGQPEVYPRYPIVNVVYVSKAEALLAHAADAVEPAASTTVRARAATEEAAPRARDAAEPPVSWEAALRAARAAGTDLMSHEEWYADLARCTGERAAQRAGEYEWVLPWVYDTASHGRFNRYFRGRFQGCDYMDLSPQKLYRWRVVPPAERPTAPPAESLEEAK